MAGTPLSRDLYERMLAAYRECPGNHSRAARAVGVDRRMTTRAWKVGWPKYPWARPISDVLTEEYDTAKSRMAAVEDRAVSEARAEREAAAAAAMEARTEEEQMIRAARKDVLGTLIVAAELHPAMRLLGQLCVKAITNMAKAAEGNGGALPRKELSEAMSLIDRHARLVSKAVHAADAIVKLSRLDRGEPGYMVGVQGSSLDDDAAMLTDAEAVAELEHAADLLEELKQQGALPAELELAVGHTATAPALPPTPSVNNPPSDPGLTH
jgi:hypothetical protein